MATDTEKEIKLVISAYTAGIEAGISKVKADLKGLEGSANDWNDALRKASTALDINPTKQINAEVQKLRGAYDTLKSSGKLSQQELAQAAGNLKTKTAELRGQQAGVNEEFKTGSGLAGSLTGKVTSLIGAYVGFRAVSGIYNAVTKAARESETAQFGLTASVKAASREFENTGGIDTWNSRVKELSAELRIYSETEVANAVSRTIDMTKRLGLSADQMTELIKRTADLSAGKTDLNGGIERVTAALRGEAESAEFLGLTLNETYIKTWYEANDVTEKAWEKLTDVEKAQVRYQVVLEQTAATQGRAAESTRTFDGALALVTVQLTNAISNNESLGDAMSRVATIISDNADEIAQLASTLTTAIGSIVEFTLRNKNLIGVLAGGTGLLLTLGKVGTAIGGINTAMKIASTVPTPAILGQGGGLNAALVARAGLYGALAVAIGATVSSYISMRDAQDEAASAEARLAESTAMLKGKLDYISETTGIQIESFAQLKQMYADGSIVMDKYSGTVLTAEQAQRQANERDAQSLKLADARAASFKRMVDSVGEMGAAFTEEALAAQQAQENQLILNQTLKDAENITAELSGAVGTAAAAYLEAKKAVDELSNAEQDNATALQDLEKKRKAYTDAVKALNTELWQDAIYNFDQEENALSNSLKARQITLKEHLQLGIIDNAEYQYQIAQLELENARQILEIRQATLEKAKEIYGADSEEYRSAAQEKIEAELNVKEASLKSSAALDSIGTAATNSASVAVPALDSIASSATNAAKQISNANDLAKGFYANWDRITTEINNLSTPDAINTYRQNNRDYLNASGQLGNAYSNSLNAHATDLLRRQTVAVQEAGREWVTLPNGQRIERTAATQRYIDQQMGTSGGSTASVQSLGTINLRAGGAEAAVTLPDGDAGQQLLAELRRLNMVTV